MAALHVTLVLLVTQSLTVEAATISTRDGKSIEDIFNTLKTIRSDILGLISSGFTAPKKVNPPAPQGTYPPSLLPPSPTTHLPTHVLYIMTIHKHSM